MRKYLIAFIILTGTNLFADNLIFNGGFDMVPWDTGWTKYTQTDSSATGTCVAHAHAHIQTDTSSVSSPNCCCLSTDVLGADYLRTGGSASAYAEATISQTFNPISNCLFKAYIRDYFFGSGPTKDKYGGGPWFEWYILLCINSNWDTIISGTSHHSTWAEICTTITDTVSGIQISSRTSFRESYSGGFWALYLCEQLWVDDIQITQTGVEEKLNIKNQISKMEIIKDKIYLSVQNSDSRLTNIRLKIYDLCGRMKETVYSGTLPKGNYTFTPNIKKTGIYFVKLTAGDFTETKKLTIIK